VCHKRDTRRDTPSGAGQLPRQDKARLYHGVKISHMNYATEAPDDVRSCSKTPFQFQFGSVQWQIVVAQGSCQRGSLKPKLRTCLDQ